MKRIILVQFLCTAILFGAVGCAANTSAPQASSAPQKTWDGIPDAVVELAQAHVGKTAQAVTKEDEGLTITDTELTGLSPLCSFPMFADGAVEVYEMEYRMKPSDPQKVVLAGGMSMDEEGWLLQTGSMGSPCLVVKNTAGEYTLLGETWTAEVELDGGWEGRLGSLLVLWGTERGDGAMIEGGWLAVGLAWLSRAEEAAAPFLGTAGTGGEPFTDENGRVWLRLAGYEKFEGPGMKDRLLNNAYQLFSEDIVDTYFLRAFYEDDPLVLEREGALYVRQDIRQAVGWDIAVDESTLTVCEGSDEGHLYYTVGGTWNGEQITWQFSLVPESGSSFWNMDQFSDAEFTVSLAGVWFGLGSRGLPSGLSEPRSSEIKSDWSKSEGISWVVETWDGLEVTAWVNEETGVQEATKLCVTSPAYESWRGIQVGSTRAEVLAAYPEMDPEYQRQVNGTPDQLFYGNPIGGNFIGFILEDNIVTQIDLEFAFD